PNGSLIKPTLNPIPCRQIVIPTTMSASEYQNVLHEMTGVAHSMTTCVLLPTCLEWNRPTLGEKYVRIARAFNMEGDASAAIRNLITSLGLPGRLRDVGVSPDAFKSIATRAVGHPMVLTNPRPVSIDDIIEILSKAW